MARLGEKRNVPHKVIDTWYYKVKDVEIERLDYVPEDERTGDEVKFTSSDSPSANHYRAHKEQIVDKTVKIEVQMHKQTVQSMQPPHPLEDVHIEVRCAELGIKLEGTDVEALREAMWSKLDAKYEITWERYYLVTLRKDHPYGGSGTGLELCYEDISKGTTWDGKALMRKWTGGEEKIRPWPGTFKDGAGKVIACIKATEANTSAMEEFCKRIDLMREKLQEFLLPENIQATLSNMAGLALLPPAPLEDEKEAHGTD